MGNPRVFLGLPVPVSVYTHTLEALAWVWVLMGFSMGMGMGILPKDFGMDIFLKKNYNCNYYTIIPHSSSDHVSSALTSGRVAPAFKSSKLTSPDLLQ